MAKYSIDVTVDGTEQQVTIDTDRDALTFEQAVEVEQLAGMSLYATPYERGVTPMKLLVAIIYVSARAQVPLLTFDAVKKIPLGDLALLNEPVVVAEADPTEAANPSPPSA